MAYRFIDDNKAEFGLRWLLNRMGIFPNAYYNYKKNRKAKYNKSLAQVYKTIEHIYHDNNGAIGYRPMRIILGRKGIKLSFYTVHLYMNKQLGLKSVARRRKPNYEYGKPHKVFKNLLKQKFYARKINRKWCTDFTYIFLRNGEVRYNCSIIDLHDRSVIASVTDRAITSDLAIKTLKKALKSQNIDKTNLILHSDQGTQYTSKAFTEYCSSIGIRQSMSAPGYPYDNAPMERYFNTLKNEYLNLHEYANEQSLYDAVEYFAYTKYNCYRPHEYNGYLTPAEARAS